MKKRVISGCVTVTGPPAAICSRKRGITLPVEPSTLPKRTMTKRVPVGSLQRLADQFRQALGGAHHVGRVDRLVGGDQHELLHAVRACAARGEHQRAEHVVEHRLPGVVVLHQRHVLVGGRMKNDRGPHAPRATARCAGHP